VYGFCGYTEKPYYRSQNYTGNYYFDSNYSNFGEDIDIAATGTWILSASNESMYEYTWMAGTSMAAPHVAAAVALLNLDKTAEYTSVDDIENRLYGCAVDLGDAGTDIYYGNGLLNLKKTSGYIGYKVNDVTAIYDGKYHNINVYDVDVQNYTISYMFETETTYSADVSNNDNFKNYTYGSRAVYFKISSEFHMDTIGVAYLTINKANVEIAIDNQTAVYGDEFVLQNNKFSVVSGTFYDSDIEDVNLVTKANKTSPVGSYNITATAGDNYNLTYQKGSFIITQRPLTIISQNQTSIYGENVSLNLQKYTFSGGIVNNDDIGITLSTEANNLSACGKYDINIDCLGDDVGNYAITKKCGKLTIEKRSIIIRLQNQQAAYGKEIKLKLLYDVLSDYKIVNDDDLNMVLSTDATSTSPVGNYSITLTYNNDNYDVTVIDGVLEMKEKGIEIIILDQMSVYGDVVQLDQTKFVYVDEADKDKVEVVLSTLATNESAAGSYDIVATTNDPNVLIMYDNPGKLNIAKRKITIELKDQKFAHGFDLDIDQSEYEIVEGCLINDDDLELTIYSDAEKFSMLGSYELKAKSNNSNYEVEVINAKLTLKVSMIDILAGVVAVIGICAIIGAIVKFKKARENNLNFTKKIKW